MIRNKIFFITATFFLLLLVACGGSMATSEEAMSAPASIARDTSGGDMGDFAAEEPMMDEMDMEDGSVAFNSATGESSVQ